MMQKLRNNPEEDTSRMMPISPQKNPGCKTVANDEQK